MTQPGTSAKALISILGLSTLAYGSKLAGDHGHLIAGTLALAVPITVGMCAATNDWRPFRSNKPGSRSPG